jgi:hypothetical protein
MSKNLFLWTLCFLWIAAGCGPQTANELPALPTLATFPTATSRPALVLTFNPVADNHVDSSQTSNTSGTAPALRTDAAPAIHSYLRFNVEGVEGTVTSATLRIYANSASGGGLNIGSVADNSWDETTITYSNAPTFGSIVSAADAFQADAWLSIDVTAFVSGNGLVSLVLTSTSDTAISFSSREGPNPPELILNVNS